ncbi:low molecular weight protein-tyrosine-phosphatase [Bacillus xiapuensis]|uniref:low molecular weight protein-tyrosine-phosphatase n=1 Tax=Bacillus xiapuensis TaxID=2014075 RepID=UPI000C23822C|nr:low molecular weight protein-tyrosine-phosphatase [Bacillus xiapuensis]
MIKVLFVCLGNICRSPMAEAMFRDLLKRERLEHIIAVDSAGTGHWHIGEPPHKGTLDVLNKNGVNSEGLKARQLVEEDAERFHYIVAMDADNVIHIKQKFALSRHQKVFKLLDLVDDAETTDVPDPYYTGNFEEVYRLIQKGNEALLRKIKREHDLN